MKTTKLLDSQAGYFDNIHLVNHFLDNYKVYPNVISSYSVYPIGIRKEIVDRYGLQRLAGISYLRNNEYSNVEVWQNKDILVSFRTNWDKKDQLVEVNLLCTDAVDIDKIKEYLSNNVCKTPKESQIYLVCQNISGLYLQSYPTTPSELNIDLNYNDDFKEIHELIIKSFKESNKGIVLLHGAPGTGKTNYLRYLLSNPQQGKKMIYLPPNLAEEIASPSFLPFLLENSNSIILIEDAENVIKSRSGHGGQAVSNLLNISEGLLSDVLNIQLVATFNCKVSDIDSALMRKGRLIANYEFEKLRANKAQKLSDKLGFNTKITTDMTLADIYNQNDKAFTKEKVKLGF